MLSRMRVLKRGLFTLLLFFPLMASSLTVINHLPDINARLNVQYHLKANAQDKSTYVCSNFLEIYADNRLSVPLDTLCPIGAEGTSERVFTLIQAVFKNPEIAVQCRGSKVLDNTTTIHLGMKEDTFYCDISDKKVRPVVTQNLLTIKNETQNQPVYVMVEVSSLEGGEHYMCGKKPLIYPGNEIRMHFSDFCEFNTMDKMKSELVKVMDLDTRTITACLPPKMQLSNHSRIIISTKKDKLYCLIK